MTSTIPQEYVSHCCKAFLILQRKDERGGDFQCSECQKEPAIAMKAESNCCRHAVILTPEDTHSFVCSNCMGWCELADPNSPDHNEQVGGDIMHTLKMLKQGKIETQKAWERIIAILDAEKTYEREGMLTHIRCSMMDRLHHPGDGGNSTAGAMLAGIDTAVAIIENILDELLQEEK